MCFSLFGCGLPVTGMMRRKEGQERISVPVSEKI